MYIHKKLYFHFRGFFKVLILDLISKFSFNFVGSNRNFFRKFFPTFFKEFLFILLTIILSILGNIQTGLPPFNLPPFSYNDTSQNPSGDFIDFQGMVSELGSALVIIPFLAILENVAIAKAFGKYRVFQFKLSECKQGRLNGFLGYSMVLPMSIT